MVANNNNDAVKWTPQLTMVNMLQILFIYLKLTEQIDWNWFLVLLPVIIETTLIVAMYSLIAVANHVEKKRREAERAEAWKVLNNK